MSEPDTSNVDAVDAWRGRIEERLIVIESDLATLRATGGELHALS